MTKRRRLGVVPQSCVERPCGAAGVVPQSRAERLSERPARGSAGRLRWNTVRPRLYRHATPPGNRHSREGGNPEISAILVPCTLPGGEGASRGHLSQNKKSETAFLSWFRFFIEFPGRLRHIAFQVLVTPLPKADRRRHLRGRFCACKNGRLSAHGVGSAVNTIPFRGE